MKLAGSNLYHLFTTIACFVSGHTAYSQHDTMARGDALHASSSLNAYAQTNGQASVVLAAFGDGENKSAELHLLATPTRTQLQTNATELYLTSGHLQLKQIPNPPAPVLNHARLYVRDNGLGKIQLCVRFPNGTIRVLATET